MSKKEKPLRRFLQIPMSTLAKVVDEYLLTCKELQREPQKVYKKFVKQNKNLQTLDVQDDTLLDGLDYNSPKFTDKKE